MHRLAVALLVAVVVAAAATIAANVIGNSKLSGINTIHLPDNVLTPSTPGAPENYLIIGSDSRAFVDTARQRQAFGDVGGTARSDVMMVVHVEPALGTALVVSFPRDTYVPITGHGTNLLNAAFAFGGPELTIKTFEQDFHIPIQHYLAVNFLGFQRIVNAIGHVKIYFPAPALDTYTGLYEPTAGCKSLDGVGALAYARSRHYQIPQSGVTSPARDNPADWIEDPRSDLDRIKRQQYFLRSLGQTALDRAAGNPLTALHLADAVVTSLTRDETLTNDQLKALVRTFRGLNPATIEMTTLPVVYDGSHLVVQYPEAQPVLNRLADLSLPTVALPAPVAPSEVKVVVVDGSGTPGRAASVEQALAARGFASGGSGDADSSDYSKTQVRYVTGAAAKGLTTALYLGTANVAEVPSAGVSLGGRMLTGDVIVVIGRDYPSLRGLLSRPAPPSTAASAPTGGPASTSTTTTSVTTPDTRYVPTSGNPLKPLVGCP